jgi:hypothetical protein
MPPGRKAFRAKDEIRTRDPDLGKVVLYQLSYFRIIVTSSDASLSVEVFYHLLSVWECKYKQISIPVKKYFIKKTTNHLSYWLSVHQKSNLFQIPCPEGS